MQWKKLLKGNSWRLLMILTSLSSSRPPVTELNWSLALTLNEFIEQLCSHVVWEIRWNNFSYFHCKIIISVFIKQTKREPEMWWSDYPWKFCRKLLIYSARWNPRYHWSNQQCSLHSIVLYYYKENEFDLASTLFVLSLINWNMMLILYIKQWKIQLIISVITKSITNITKYN